MEFAASGSAGWSASLRAMLRATGDGAWRRLPGLALCAAISTASLIFGQLAWSRAQGLSPLVIGMLCGAVAGNLFHGLIGNRTQSGIAFSRQRLLRLGIILYGVRLTLGDIAHIGLPGVAADALVLISTFALALFFGTRILKMDCATVTLIGAGSSICGAAAILATEPVAKARPEQVTVAVATVVLFGTIATFLYPWLYHMNLDWRILPVSSAVFGMYIGSTVHEVGQVVAAARLVDMEAVNAAVIAKMIRVMMLPCFLAVLPALLARGRHGRDNETCAIQPAANEAKPPVPWFAVGFIMVIVFNSILPLPQGLLSAVTDIDTLLLTMAMSALGLGTRIADFRKAGAKPVFLGTVLFAWLVAGGACINMMVAR